MKLITHLHLFLRLRMRGVTPSHIVVGAELSIDANLSFILSPRRKMSLLDKEAELCEWRKQCWKIWSYEVTGSPKYIDWRKQIREPIYPVKQRHDPEEQKPQQLAGKTSILSKANERVWLRCWGKFHSYKLWHRTDWNIGTKVLKDHGVSVFRVVLWIPWRQMQQAPPKGWYYLYNNTDGKFIGLHTINHSVAADSGTDLTVPDYCPP